MNQLEPDHCCRPLKRYDQGEKNNQDGNLSDNHSSIISKSVQLLDILAVSTNSLSYTELVAATGFSKSSTHRILSILVNEGLVEFSESEKSYSVGPKLITWARAAWQKTDINLIKDIDLIKLRDESGMNVAVSVLVENAVLFIRTVDKQSVRYAPKVGQQSPLHCTAAGKVFLAFGDPVERERLLSEIEYEKFTDRTIATRAALQKELVGVREKGFASVKGEEMLQISGIAVPVTDYQARVVAAISLWAPSKLATIEELIATAPALMDFGKGISARFGQMV